MKKLTSPLKRLVIPLLILVVTPVAGLSQASQGSLQGTILDSSGAALPGVTVSLIDMTTDVTREGVSNDIGFYHFPRLPVGRYRIEASLPGFKTAASNDVVITVQKATVVDLELEVGEISEEVLVTGTLEKQVETTSPTISNLVSAEKMEDLPLNEKVWSKLALLQPGTAPVVNTGAYSDVQGFAGFVNGTRTYQNQASLDGIDFNDPVVPGGVAVPELAGGGVTMDAIQEFRVSTAAADAESGVTAGAQINLVTKRGSNNIHGTVFWFLRNNALDARDFFDRVSSTNPTGGTLPFRRNQFGFTLGGPIATDSTFFFGSYEGFRQRLLSSRIPGVPTPRLREQIPGGAANGFLREVVEAYYPLPSGSFDDEDLVATFFGSQNRQVDRDQFSIRIDHNFGAHDLMGRYMYLDSSGPPGSLSSSGLPTEAGTSFLIRTQNVGITDTWLISTNALNEFKVGYMRNVLAFGGAPYPAGIDALGVFGERNTAESVPRTSFGGTGIATISPSGDVSSGRAQGTYHVADTFSYTSGRHSLKWGGDFRLVQDNEISLSRRRSFSFLGFGPPFDSAEFGLTTATARSLSQRFFLDPKDGNRYLRLPHLAFFVNDNFRITPSFSLNLGLRWELLLSLREKFGNYNNTYPLDASGNPIEDGAVTDAASIGIVPIDVFRTTQVDYNNFAPRIGFAWDPFGQGTTSIRGSYSIFYDQVALVGYRGGGSNPPFVLNTSLRGVPFGSFADPAVDGLTPDLAGINPANVVPFVQYWTFGGQHELAHETVLEINYVGTKGTHLDRRRGLNFGPGFAGQRPNPDFNQITLTENTASSIYHALQMELNRRLTAGVMFQVSYTWSKAIDDASDQRSTLPQFQNVLEAERGLADFHTSHNAVINFGWELPFGANRRYLSDTSGVVNQLLGGWMVTGILQFATGAPFSIRAGTDQNGDGFTNDRPVFVGSDLGSIKAPDSADKTVFLVASPNLIIDPTAGPFDTIGRNVLTGPSLNSIDLALMKRGAVTDTVGYEFQAAFFNIFNMAVFDVSERRTPSFNNIRSPLFGRILRTRIPGRQIQFGLRFKW